MTNRTSALREAEQADARARAHRQRAQEEELRAQNFLVAHRTESEVTARLRAIEPWGWRLLVDRRWPGRSRANIDLIAVGPGGVLVIDVKCWAEVDIYEGRLYRGQADAEDELDKLRHVTELVTDTAARLGLAPAEVVPVMVFIGQAGTNTEIGRVRILDERGLVPWAHRRGSRLTDEQVAALTETLAANFPPYDQPDQLEISTVIPEPVLPAGRHHRDEPESLFDVEALAEAILEHEMAKPIENWMTFLHPEQIRVVRRMSDGPARIRGGAGTGKTVVALHRAAYLAEATSGPVLFTTFVKSLPPVLGQLYGMLSPATSERVQFVNLHAWSSQLLRDRGQRPVIDVRFAEASYARSWSRHGKQSCLGELGVPWRYWRDEIDYVIKGRGIVDFDDYAALKRTGRRTPLQANHREVVWEIYRDYEAQLREQQVLDFNDLINLALAEVRERPLAEPPAAVIADEVQDLSCQAVRLLAELSDAGRKLLIVGDGQQQIYPGGYTLVEAGLAISGRSTVLRTNYRNSEAILAAAAQVVDGDEFLDLDGSAESGRRDGTAVRGGGLVLQVEAQTPEELQKLAIEHVVRLVGEGHDPGGVAVICATNKETAAYLVKLRQAGVAAIDLRNYSGVTTNDVKVGTVQRAKGLEFKHVLHPVAPPSRAMASVEGERELEELRHRQQFVAMTRARDSLWIGRVAG